MASKSKKRRRVFRASCILAALIIAGSSFAWFTSKDEVTNRLSASSDYGVSIIESFTPPKMWVPGQEVNKDVYAVNTGNIAAFVKENVSGVLNYTFETKVGEWDDECLELNDITKTAIDGVTTNEAGGFLAWTDTNEAPGELASARQTEAGVTTRWAPTEKGTYIFRRSIDHNGTATPGDHPADDTFTYAGYYYVPNQVNNPDFNSGEEESETNPKTIDSTTPGDGKYYKIVIGDDTFRAKETGTGVNKNYEFDIYATQASVKGVNDTTVTFNRDGTITGTPKIWYVKEKNTDDLQVDFVYEEASDAPEDTHGPRLVVEYATAIGESGDYDAIAAKARAQVDLINRRGQYYQDKAEYEQAVADYTYALKLAQARNELQGAAERMYQADKAVNETDNGTADKLSSAWTYLKNAANGQDHGVTADSLMKAVKDLGITETYDAVSNKWPETVALSPQQLLDAATGTDSTRSVWDVLSADQDSAGAHRLNDVQTNYVNMQNIWADIQEDIKDLNDALEEYKDQTGGSAYITPEKAREYERTVNAKLASLATNLDLYKKAYADLLGQWEDATAHTASDLSLGDLSTTTNGIKDRINTLYKKVTDANENDVKAKQNVFNEKVTEYVNAFNADEAAGDALETEEAAWEAAKTKYNSDVSAAKTEYEKITHQTAGTPQPNTAVEYKDNSATLVRKYSARREEQTGLATTHTDANDPAYDPTLATFDNTVSTGNFSPNFAHDFDYYRTLDENATNAGTAGIDLPKKDTKLAVLKRPAGELNADGTITNVNGNETWDEATLADAAIPTKTIKSYYDDLKTAETGSEALYVAAQKVYDDATAAADATSKITIYVNLDKDYADYWQYAGDKDATGTESTKNAEFYYKYILEPGETSHKLIDSVTLADSVSAKDYKNLTFDLDVTLDSAQITYADDQRTITTEAVDANAEAFKLQVEEADKPLAFDQVFDWEDRNAETNNIYKVNGDVIGKPEVYTDIAGYNYRVNMGTAETPVYYVGESDSGNFYKVNGTGNGIDSAAASIVVSKT